MKNGLKIIITCVCVAAAGIAVGATWAAQPKSHTISECQDAANAFYAIKAGKSASISTRSATETFKRCMVEFDDRFFSLRHKDKLASLGLSLD